MTPVQRITGNLGLTLFGNVLAKISFLIVGIVAARHLGREGYGIYSLAIFLAFLFATLSDGGLRIVMTREVARTKEEAGKHLGNILLMKVALGVLSLAIFSGTVLLMDLSPIKVKAVYLAFAAYLVYFFGMIAIGIFRAYERMVYEWAVLLLQGASFLLLVLVAIYFEATVLGILAALLVSYALMSAVAWIFVSKRFVRPEFHIDVSLWRLLVKEALPIGISIFLFMTYNRIGTIVLELLRGSSEVGLFNAAFSLTRNVNVIPIAIMGALLPTLSQLAVSEREKVTLAYGKAFRLMLVIALPMAVGGTLLAEPIVHLIYGAEFAGAGVALQIMVWSLLFFFLSLVTSTVLQATNSQVLWTYALIAGVFVNLVLNIALVPRFGILGASLALLVADIVIFGFAFYTASRTLDLPINTIAATALKVLASTALMAAILFQLGDHNLFLLVFLGAVAYGLSLLFFRVYDQEDVALLKEAIKPRKHLQQLAMPGSAVSEQTEP